MNLMNTPPHQSTKRVARVMLAGGILILFFILLNFPFTRHATFLMSGLRTTVRNWLQVPKESVTFVKEFLPQASTSPSPITPQPIPPQIVITNAPTRSQSLLAIEEYFAQGLPFRLFWLLKGPKGDTGPAGPRGLTTSIVNSGGGIPSNLSLQTLTVSGTTALAGLTADDATIGTLTAGTSTFGPTTLSSATITGFVNSDLIPSGSFDIGSTAFPWDELVATSASFRTVVAASGSFGGQLKATKVPVLAHTGTWPNFTNTDDATLLVMPATSLPDGTLIAAHVGSVVKFIVDSEGDIYGNNLILTGSTTQGTTTIAGDLIVEGNVRLGDAPGDKLKLPGTVVPASIVSPVALTIQASSALPFDLTRWLNSSGTPIAAVDTSGNLITSGVVQAGSMATQSYNRFGTAVATHATVGANNDLLISGDLEIDGSAYFDGTVNFGTIASASLFYAQDGTAALPSYTFSLDQNTGLFRKTADSISITTGGVERLNLTNTTASISNALYINSAGNVGIGDTTPDARLDVAGSGIFDNELIVTDALQVGGAASAAYSRFGTSATTSGLITGNTDVLVSGDLQVLGTIVGNLIATSASASGTFEANTASASRFFAQDGTATLSSYTFSADQNTGLFRGGTDILGFTTAGVERLNIDATGDFTISGTGSHSAAGEWNFDSNTFVVDAGTNRVGIGTATPAMKLDVEGGGALLGGMLYVSPTNVNTLNSGYGTAADNSDIWINYRGYNDALAYFRDFRVGNGKGGQIALFQGSTGNLTIAGTINGQTITSAANFTGTVVAATSYTVGNTVLAQNRLYMTSGSNLHLDSFGSGITYINYYAGTGGVNFCNGANVCNANVSAAGAFTGTSLGLGSGAITSGLINGQTITSAANFTGSLTIGPGNFTQNITHGNNARQFLSAANNGGGTGDANLYWWISEPGATWTGAGIARNMSNSAASFPRINTGLSGQMMRFTEGNNIEFTVETAAGTRTVPFTIANGGITTPGTITSGLINGQTITSAANFTGSLNAVGNVVAYGFQGNANVGGTGAASWHPSGIYSAGPNWLYGSISLNGAMSGGTTANFSSTVTAPTFSGALSGNATSATTATLANGVNQFPNRTDATFYQINWNNAAGGDKNLYSSAMITLRSSGYGAIGWNGSAWYIEGNANYGLYSNTGFNAAGGLYDAGNRVCSSSTCSVGTITSGLINGQTITSAANLTGTLAVASTVTVAGNLPVAGLVTIGTSLTVGTSAVFGGNIMPAMYVGRAGIGGVADNNTFSIVWVDAAGCAHLWIDASDFGCITTTSDQRIKKNTETLTYAQGLDAVMQLRPVEFNWKDPSANSATQFGFIAQEVQPIFPNLVHNTGMITPDTPDGLFRLDYNGLIPVAIKAIQELNAKVDAVSLGSMEMYPTSSNIEEGEIVVPSSTSFVLDTFNNKVPKLIRSSRPYQQGIIGITSVASQAGDLNEKPLALSGRVLLKVSTDNGPIHVGDRITSSDIAGVGMKATQPGMTVGTALESTDGSQLTTSYQRILVFVGAQYWAPEEAMSTEVISQTGIASGSWQSGTPPAGGLQSLFASIVDAFNTTFGIVFEKGLVRVAKGIFEIVEAKLISANVIEVTTGITVYEEVTREPHCLTVADGATVVRPGKCETSTLSPEPTPTPIHAETPTPTPSDTPMPELTPPPAGGSEEPSPVASLSG